MTIIETILFIVGMLFSAGLIMLIFHLVPTIGQLKNTLADLEKTSAEARELVVKLQSVSDKVEEDIGKFDQILDASKETVTMVSDSVKFVNKNMLKKSAGLLAIIPAIKLGWDLVKKFKGGK